MNKAKKTLQISSLRHSRPNPESQKHGLNQTDPNAEASMIATGSQRESDETPEQVQGGAGHAAPVQLGFWIYLMTDCVLFASLFATFMVLRSTGMMSSAEHAVADNLLYVFIETVLLLVWAHKKHLRKTQLALLATGLLGGLFLLMEIHEFSLLVHDGLSWQNSAFLSAYFGLVGTHGLHIFAGLLWLGATLLYLAKRGFTARLIQRLTMFTMFWHFLDIVWVGIFTIVYLLGAL
jgi:cytochrome o ubiquinol oxidase subunit 3